MSGEKTSALEVEYLLLGSALSQYGTKLMAGAVPQPVKQLGEQEAELTASLNSKEHIEAAMKKNKKTQSNTTNHAAPAPGSEGDVGALLHRHLKENCRLERVVDWTSTAQGTGSDAMLVNLLKNQVSDPNGALNSHAPQLVYRVVAHDSAASGAAGSQRIAREFDGAASTLREEKRRKEQQEDRSSSTGEAADAAATAPGKTPSSKMPVTTYAFHGSKTENWYSILQSGFRNVCVEEKVLYGHGIYLTTALHVAQDFASFGKCPVEPETLNLVSQLATSSANDETGSGGVNSVIKSPWIRLVGVVEVCHHPDSTRSGEFNDPSLPETYLVVKNPSLLKLRYLLVWQTGHPSTGSSSEKSSGQEPPLETTGPTPGTAAPPAPVAGGGGALPDAVVDPAAPPPLVAAGAPRAPTKKNGTQQQGEPAAWSDWIPVLRWALVVVVVAVVVYFYKQNQQMQLSKRVHFRKNL